jgi:hypothetical protein
MEDRLHPKKLNSHHRLVNSRGNELVIPPDFKEEKIKIKAELKSDPAIWKEVTIWIKKYQDS